MLHCALVTFKLDALCFARPLLTPVPHARPHPCWPQNVLLDEFGGIKLADFGMARPIRNGFEPYSPQVVTLWYVVDDALIGMYCSVVPIVRKTSCLLWPMVPHLLKGTVHPNFSLRSIIIQRQLMCGVSGVCLSKW